MALRLLVWSIFFPLISAGWVGAACCLGHKSSHGADFYVLWVRANVCLGIPLQADYSVKMVKVIR